MVYRRFLCMQTDNLSNEKDTHQVESDSCFCFKKHRSYLLYFLNLILVLALFNSCSQKIPEVEYAATTSAAAATRYLRYQLNHGYL
jgi:hypothetical protein